MEFNPSFSIADTLRQLQSEKLRAEVQLRGGHVLSGAVTTVGEHFVVLSALASRDFYDAVVRIDDISAIVAHVRKK